MNYVQEMKLGDPDTFERERDLRVLSLGAGVQSSTLLFKMLHGEIEPPDVAIFSDTGNEPQAVYDWLEYLKKQMEGKIKLVIVRNQYNKGNIIDDFKADSGRHSLFPLHITKSDGNKALGRRTCTSEYKIRPLQDWLREYFDVVYLRSKHIEMVMGISLDEIQRAKKAPMKWQVNCYPLIENKITRQDCKDWMQDKGYPPPPRSACIICPFHSNEEWLHIKNQNEEEFQQAIDFDEWLRDPENNSIGMQKFKQYNEGSVPYLHKDRIPLKVANLSKPKEDVAWTLFDDECEGMCGV